MEPSRFPRASSGRALSFAHKSSWTHLAFAFRGASRSGFIPEGCQPLARGRGGRLRRATNTPGNRCIGRMHPGGVPAALRPVIRYRSSSSTPAATPPGVGSGFLPPGGVVTRRGGFLNPRLIAAKPPACGMPGESGNHVPLCQAGFTRKGQDKPCPLHTHPAGHIWRSHSVAPRGLASSRRDVSH